MRKPPFGSAGHSHNGGNRLKPLVRIQLLAVGISIEMPTVIISYGTGTPVMRPSMTGVTGELARK